MAEASPARAPHVVAVIGSPRRRGNTSILVDAALDELAAAGCRCDKVMLAERSIGACQGHEDCAERAVCALRDDGPAVLDLAYAADGLLLATPVYYENVSAQMKAFIDRSLFRYTHDEWLPAKVVGLLAVSAETGLDDALAALRRYVALSTSEKPPIVSFGGYADELGAAAGDPELLAGARRLGRQMAAALGLSPAGSHASQ